MDIEKNKYSTKSLPLLIIVHCLAFGAFATNGKNPAIGVLLACSLFFLAVYTDDLIYAIPIVLIGNDGLGTVFLGKIAFGWFALGLVIIERLFKRKYKVTISWVYKFGILVLYTLFLYAVQETILSTIIKTFIYVVLVLHLDDYDRRKQIDWECLFMWIAISCFLTALHLVVLGGIPYAESSGKITSMRYGIVGTGTGDPNYGGLRLLIGVICTFYCKRLKLLRIPMILILIYAIVNTISVTTIFALLIIIVCGILAEKGISKKIKYIFGLVLGVIVIGYVFVTLPSELLPSGLDALGYRLNEKINFLWAGNYANATTGRSDLASEQLLYAMNRNAFNWLFGMEATPVPGFKLLSHNTFVDFIIHFGMIGGLLLFLRIVSRLKNVYLNSKEIENIRAGKLQLKILFCFFSFGLSIYMDTTFALWVFVLLLI